MKPVISLLHADVSIKGKQILSNVSTVVPHGKIMGLLGPSGAGKTTLMRVIMGLQHISGGTVEVLGRPAGSSVLRNQIGYVTQAPSIYDDLTVHENLRYFASMIGVSKEQAKEAMAEVHLSPFAKRLVSTLSGGQRARVSLAVALLDKPPLLVLDEPTVGLDPLLRHELWQHFRKLAAAGTTLLISSHVMDEATQCDSLILLREGKVLAMGTPGQLTSQTHTRSVEDAFLHLVTQKRGAS